MRKIKVNESNTNLKYTYFQIYLLDGIIPAINLNGEQPEISLNGSAYYTIDIDSLEEIGSGSYRSLIHDSVFATVGNIILTRFENINTIPVFAENIEVVASLDQIGIFENDSIPTVLSYCTISEAESYFATRINSQSWDDASLNDKIKALNTATSDIDNLNFSGIKADCNQLLEFPRIYKKRYDIHHNLISVIAPIIPPNIKKACCEISISYLEGVLLEDEINNMNIISSGFGGVQTMYSSNTAQEHFRAGIISSRAWQYIKPFLFDPLTLRIEKA